jgi:uncharacterized protein (DUF488 family)
MQTGNDAASGPPPGGSLDECRVFTIGHSHHDLPRLTDLLRRARVTVLADVRSQPFSRRLAQFNRPELEHGLKAAGIAYVFLGDALGGRPQQPSLYDGEGRVDYVRVRAAAFFRQGLERLGRACANGRVALLCAEEDPLDCHRGLMITPALVERGIVPAHLRGDGSVETTAAMEKRLLAETKVDDGSMDGLFAAALTPEDRQQMLTEAYRIMARRKAFRLRAGEEE